MMAYLSNKISRLFKKIFHFVYNTSTLCFLSESIFSVSLKGDKTTIYLFNRLFISVCKDNVTSSTEFKSVFNSSARQNHNHLLIQLKELSRLLKREGKYSVLAVMYNLCNPSLKKFPTINLLILIISLPKFFFDLASTFSCYLYHFPHYAHKSQFHGLMN